MRVLYHLTLSPSARKVRIVLAEKNLEFTLKLEKVWERRPEFLALNPAGEVPVLIEPDGTVIAGPEASVEHLDEAYREKLLIGINPVDRAEVRRLAVGRARASQEMVRPDQIAAELPRHPRRPCAGRAAAQALRRPRLLASPADPARRQPWRARGLG